MSSRVAITGASGYLGSQLALRFERDAWAVTRFSRSAPKASTADVPYDLDGPVGLEVFRSRAIDALVHCAYDFRALGWPDVRRVNVEGSARLFGAARGGGVKRIVAISTISAFPGCRSIYGRAKLEIEAEALKWGAAVLRPGLVYGDPEDAAGGMMGSLRRSARRRVVPMVGGGRQPQYLVHIDDLYALVRGLCAGEVEPPARPVVVASPHAHTLREVVDELARREGAHPRLVPVPWRAVWLALKGAETAGLRPGYRSDSLVSLVNQDPHPDFGPLSELGVSVRDFGASAE